MEKNYDFIDVVDALNDFHRGIERVPPAITCNSRFGLYWTSTPNERMGFTIPRHLKFTRDEIMGMHQCADALAEAKRMNSGNSWGVGLYWRGHLIARGHDDVDSALSGISDLKRGESFPLFAFLEDLD